MTRKTQVNLAREGRMQELRLKRVAPERTAARKARQGTIKLRALTRQRRLDAMRKVDNEYLEDRRYERTLKRKERQLQHQQEEQTFLVKENAEDAKSAMEHQKRWNKVEIFLFAILRLLSV
jgi:poly-gamma-glutamate capsule biosynthesis protein CapA/YwtB (metallophosphatase superfamily)